MNSNSTRTKQQYAAVPATTGLIAAFLWPMSYAAASSVTWLSAPTSTFADFWLGAAAVVTFGGAAVATCVCAGTATEGVWRWFHQ